MANVLAPLAQGCEEVEAVTIIDLLRRAGITVVAAGLDDRPVKGAHGITLVPDCSLDLALKQEYDMVVLPGGMPGTNNLNADKRLHQLLQKMVESGKFAGAICAAPIVLAKAGVLKGKRATSYPGFLDKLNPPDVTFTGAPVERDGKIITSRGPGTAMDFALAVIEMLMGREKRDAVEAGLMRP